MKLDETINMLLKYIDEHLEDILTTKELAKIAGYSEYHFIRMFKAYMNTTIMEYVCKRKLIKASEDIIAGRKILDVAMKYGWQSHSGFTKAFKKEFGFYPSLLRVMKISMESLGGNEMSHVFMESIKVGVSKEELFIILQEKMQVHGIVVDKNELVKVYNIACNAYENITRYSGEEYVTHTINVSILLAELDAELNIILAGMFCDVHKKGSVQLENLRKELPKEIYDIVVKIQMADEKLEMEEDGVIMIKLAERLHNMRTIEFIDDNKKREKAKETIEFFMPLARRLDNKKLIDELNDLSMKYYIKN